MAILLPSVPLGLRPMAVGGLAQNRRQDVRVNLLGRVEGDGPRIPPFALHDATRVAQKGALVNHQQDVRPSVRRDLRGQLRALKRLLER
jgi:hypothetical protein